MTSVGYVKLLYRQLGLSCILQMGQHLGPVVVIEDEAIMIASYNHVNNYIIALIATVQKT